MLRRVPCSPHTQLSRPMSSGHHILESRTIENTARAVLGLGFRVQVGGERPHTQASNISDGNLPTQDSHHMLRFTSLRNRKRKKEREREKEETRSEEKTGKKRKGEERSGVESGRKKRKGEERRGEKGQERRGEETGDRRREDRWERCTRHRAVASHESRSHHPENMEFPMKKIIKSKQSESRVTSHDVTI